ncbi:polyprenol monophosphomannose synthase [Candidatus Woesearchaeota archaeon]|nr:polyprenol monophosphomannose synthase [Candidatus Woesearchaeota archaeon]
MKNKKAMVMIPTYNEKENITKLIGEILKLKDSGKIKDDIGVVVVDDNSPDGTWKLVENYSKKDKRVNLLLRKKNRGRGLAGIDGFKYCLRHKAEYVIEMDADFSHNPKHIPALLKEIKRHDVVLGSRSVRGGKQLSRGIIRYLITYFANLYIRLLLGLKVRDCNSGYRCFRRKVLEEINLDSLRSKGPDIVQEVLFKAHLKGFRIKEVPIVFKERVKGKSKLGLKHLYKGYLMVLKLGVSRERCR